MPNFATTTDIAAAAIVELMAIFREGKHAAPDGQRRTTANGNGVWSADDYFNCGVNKDVNVAPPVGDMGSLTRAQLESLEEWFRGEYAAAGAVAVLRKPDGSGWNYTLVPRAAATTAFNFHLATG